MKSIVVANWKMNPPTFRAAKKLLEVTKKSAERSGALIVVAPHAVQNAHFEGSGAYTGEISLQQAHDAGASYVVIGHAERRAMGESEDDTRKKVAAALARSMTPILCVGEKSRSASGEYFGVVKQQLRAGFTNVPAGKVARVIVAYEPIWAIGAEAAMSPRDMHEMSIFIRKTIVEMHGELGHRVVILYGGSIDEKNAGEMLRLGDVRGLLVGRASADPVRVSALLRSL
ncbi:MAG: Triosephosphate isomerase [Candidatus Kaiserbacteria bacterium GW2011_GWC2_52_8b]|uniref:Triosephosphate isomerase n=1 Tax=Candidatus Kaiserbacteria bacterium GW2011_GWC2_52_8b TaxID=1618676 RepID=A0A0G2AD51_9BACT|nr:MAG: Triosephosphate isomerase [Candidatus Kaiserbacteria bacterium GW2011_GWC2_52_8b]